ncbi:BLUF domain-containing protein [Acinetobacter radioresistens]|uniref:BLUF domain-containing protein n=1 Tax=Acinetobacter radioresistens TaxID=40216 RepID=UPI000ECC2C77|nr:BLUF domain-containing protein [Acinetobacter radioresistens]MCK4086198.1 BLUF domain-containing protein [Acinetobacter radioresistens]QCS11977.1 BLUF domain-containing protein [Acinetobacter radioresistens]HAK33327.1 blue light sensor protein [Acinetobacter radioresistens]
MIQLCYASKTTSPSDYLLMDLREILSEAQSFNALNSINGVLFYADQYFFQCLEGEREQVLDLFERIKEDQRHQEIIEFGVHPISEQNFDGWAMKFVRRNSEVSEFFQKLGHLHFSPTKLNHHNLNDFLHILTKARQETQA